MRLFAISDIHIDYPDNARWVEQVSDADYRNDVLILAGDLTEDRSLLAWCLVPGSLRREVPSSAVRARQP